MMNWAIPLVAAEFAVAEAECEAEVVAVLEAVAEVDPLDEVPAAVDVLLEAALDIAEVWFWTLK